MRDPGSIRAVPTRYAEGALKVLWVDDDHELTADLSDYFRGDGFDIACAHDLASANRMLAAQVYDLVLVDIGLPDGSGLSLIKQTPRTQAREFVVLTGQGSLKSAVEAMRFQAFDYLMKPLELDELRNVLTRVRNSRHAPRETPLAERARGTPARNAGDDQGDIAQVASLLIGASPPMRQAQTLLARAAVSEITVLLQGESGTGKEVAALSVHKLSGRSERPFVALNCAAVSPQLIASELFGHEKGSFTGAYRAHKGIFERAEGGTLFLDEITEMPVDYQASLLRVLETGRVVRVGGDAEVPVNVRVVAATNRNPVREVETGRFRLDLYYRLQVFPIELPPLRERGNDVLLLAQNFLEHFAARGADGQVSRRYSAAAQAALLAHDWPGNVRELRNVVERACLLSNGVIEVGHLLLSQHLPRSDVEPAALAASSAAPRRAVTGGSLRDVEYELIMQTLAANAGNKTRAAAQLGISVKTLYNKLKRFEAQGLTTVPVS